MGDSTIRVHSISSGGVDGDTHSVGNPLDTLIIGAGFGGLRMLYEMKRRGFSARVLEAGSGVGGTWYWNRYPGARTDSESWVYIFTFLEDLGLEWTWKERYPQQAEVEEYLNKITDFLGLRENITFNTRIVSAYRDDQKNLWKVKTAQNTEFTCRNLVTATGPLATPIKPPFKGLDSFQGEWYQTGLWPKEKIDFTGKRVALIGTGATGVQIAPIIAHTAKSLTVFQRTPNYVLPGRNHPLSEEHAAELKRNFQGIANRARNQIYGFDMENSSRTIDDMTDDVEIERVLENGWEKGGFRYIFETFGDILLSAKCNEIVSEFVRKKTRAIVEDKKTADLLCPDYPIVSKRPPLGHFYYEVFNRSNVELVSIKDDPIEEITPNGLRTGGKEYEFDIIIFAIGFDAVTGTLAQIDIQNAKQRKLAELLQNDLKTGYGITVPGFPNFYMIFGPQSVFANGPLMIDNTADWIGKTLSYMRSNGYDRMDCTQEGAQAWGDHVNQVFELLVIHQTAKDTRSWMIGANVDSKTTQPMFYFGGLPAYIAACDKELEGGYSGHKFSTSTAG